MITSKATRPASLKRKSSPAVVILQNDHTHRINLLKNLSNNRWRTVCANDLKQVRDILKRKRNIRLVIADINCDDPAIMPVLSEMQSLTPDSHYILTTSCVNLPNITSVRRNLRKQRLHLLLKPYYFDEMWQIVRNVLESEVEVPVH